MTRRALSVIGWLALGSFWAALIIKASAWTSRQMWIVLILYVAIEFGLACLRKRAES